MQGTQTQGQPQTQTLASTFPPPPPFWVLYEPEILKLSHRVHSAADASKSTRTDRGDDVYSRPDILQKLILVKTALLPVLAFQQQLILTALGSAEASFESVSHSAKGTGNNVKEEEKEEVKEEDTKAPATGTGTGVTSDAALLEAERSLEIANLLLAAMFKVPRSPHRFPFAPPEPSLNTGDGTRDAVPADAAREMPSFLPHHIWTPTLWDFGNLTAPPEPPLTGLKKLIAEGKSGATTHLDEDYVARVEQIDSKYLAFGMVHDRDFERAAESDATLRAAGVRDLVGGAEVFKRDMSRHLVRLVDSLFLNLNELVKILAVNPEVFEYKLVHVREIVMNFHVYLNIYRFNMVRSQLAQSLRAQTETYRRAARALTEAVNNAKETDLAAAHHALSNALDQDRKLAEKDANIQRLLAKLSN